MLEKNPADRPTASECLRHEYFSKLKLRKRQSDDISTVSSIKKISIKSQKLFTSA